MIKIVTIEKKIVFRVMIKSKIICILEKKANSKKYYIGGQMMMDGDNKDISLFLGLIKSPLWSKLLTIMV